LSTVEGSAEQIRQRIGEEALLAPGDKIRLVTADGETHKFKVTEVDLGTGRLSGKDETVAITDIVALQKRELSWVKTGVLIGVAVGLLSSDCEGPDCSLGGGPICCS
jgi:hypothetical protein